MNYQQSMFTKMVQPLLEGFAWGKGAMDADGETSTSDLDKFAETHLTADLARDLADLNLLQGGIDFINKVDAFVDRYKIFEAIRELLPYVPDSHRRALCAHGPMPASQPLSLHELLRRRATPTAGASAVPARMSTAFG